MNRSMTSMSRMTGNAAVAVGRWSHYYENLVSSLFVPDRTNMANVAHFMCELVTNPKVWDAWKGKLPVVINAAAKG